MKKYSILGVLILLLASFTIIKSEDSQAAELRIGTKTVDLTPDRPVQLDGQMGTRISQGVKNPITANIIAFESGNKKQQAIFVSLDLIAPRIQLIRALTPAVKKALPDFDVSHLVIFATHTHTAPVCDDTKYYVPPEKECMLPSEYVVFAVNKLVPAIVEAWNNKTKVQYSYGLDFAAVAWCRRAVYKNGQAIMYGKTNIPDFRTMEGFEDHDLGSIFFWNEKGKLLAIIVNVSCPSQEQEGLSVLHADFWHYVRENLRLKLGKDVCIVAQCGTGGDVSPHTQYRRAAEDRMSRFRGLDRIEEIARRISCGVLDTYNVVQNGKSSNIPFKCVSRIIDLPNHRVTKQEYEETMRDVRHLGEKMKTDPTVHRLYGWAKNITDRYEDQQKGKQLSSKVPISVIRIGDTAICTNPFELYTSYGIRIKARSDATQTFIAQLARPCGLSEEYESSAYLPSREAYSHGGYGAIVKSILIGPEGGQVLVEESLKTINESFSSLNRIQNLLFKK